jgi:hypothetical protein
MGRQHRHDEVTRTKLVGWTGTRIRELQAHHSPRNKRDCAAAGVCAKEIKKELNTLDEADFVRDVDNRDSHYQYHFEIVGAKGISQHLSRLKRLVASRW